MVLCKVLVLDGTEHDFEMPKNAKVQDLLDAVCEKIELVEKEYFGLTYEEKKTGKFWLNNSKKLSKYVTDGSKLLALEVKFYPPEPSLLENESTRYQLFLQLRRDILVKKLPCSFLTLALLGSYAVQSEIGDHNPSNNTTGHQYLKNISFAPDHTTELLDKIAELHITHRGNSPGEAETEYLNNAKKLSLYGVHMHSAKDVDNEDVQIGVCAAGLLIFKHQLRIHRFVWAKIIKISYKRNVFTIRIRPGEHEKVEATFDYKLPSYTLAKRLWRLAVEHHAFFRLKDADSDPNRSKFPRFGSSHRIPGKTSYQMSQGNSGSLGNIRQGGQFSKSMEGLGGFSTDHAEQYLQEQNQKTATLTVRDRLKGSLPLLDQEDLDQYYNKNIGYDPRNKIAQWQTNANYEPYGTASSGGQSLNSYPTNAANDPYSRHYNGSIDSRGGRGEFATKSRPAQLAGAEDDDLPPYQDDHLMQKKRGKNFGDDNSWNSQNTSTQVKTSTRTYVGPDGSIITEHCTERDGVVERKITKVQREKQEPDFDYDRALSDAILAVTNMNADLAVEKIEIQTKEEREPQYYDDDDDEDEDICGPGETVI